MVKIDYGNPDPERGIFGCAYAANEYAAAKAKLPKLDAAIDSVARSVNQLLNEAAGTYYTSSYGASGPFRASARKSIEHLECITEAISKFGEDMRQNFLRESESATSPISFFISYSHRDRQFADRFVQDLRMQGYTVWRDDDNIMLGESIRRSIEKGLTGSRFVVALISRASVQSEWCQKELDMALADETTTNIKVLPVVIDDCSIPPILQTKGYLIVEDYTRDFEKFLSLLPSGPPEGTDGLTRRPKRRVGQLYRSAFKEGEPEKLEYKEGEPEKLEYRVEIECQK